MAVQSLSLCRTENGEMGARKFEVFFADVNGSESVGHCFGLPWADSAVVSVLYEYFDVDGYNTSDIRKVFFYFLMEQPMTSSEIGKKKLLVISGGSRGIGAATIDRFIAAGYSAINLSRSATRNPAAINISVDMSDRGWTEKCRDELLQHANQADEICLVHNSGVLYKDSIFDVTAEQLYSALQINVVAAAQLNQLLLPSMSSGSSILYVASTLGEKAVAGTCSYVVSKHAMVGLMKASCQDLFGSGIHTVSICPGFTDTEMLREHLGNDETVLESIASGVSFNRLITPDEIAAALEFASDAPALNGSVIHANLGQRES